MIDKLKKWLRGAESGTPAEPETDELQAAAALLLVEAASLDGSFDGAEEEAVRDALAHRFELSAPEVEQLVEEARTAQEHSVEMSRTIRVLKQHLGRDDRIQILEMLWEVALADGVVHDYEANLVRRVTGLLHVPDKEAGLARKAAEDHLASRS